MFRIIWLAGIFLAVVLAAMAVKMSPKASPELATATIVRATADADAVTFGSGIEHGTLNKADKLIIAPPVISEVPPEPLAAGKPPVSVPATRPPIISRHRHEPTALVMVAKSSPSSVKNKQHKQ
jgi:hypothetical protein